MNHPGIQATLLKALTSVAPEVDAAAIAPAEPLRRQIDLDSDDWHNFLIEIDHLLGVDIPYAEAARLNTLDELVEYCVAHA